MATPTVPVTTRVPLDIGAIHFIGIGGIGMSGIAEIMHNLGYKVQGSDAVENTNVKRLKSMGIRVAIGQAAEPLHVAALAEIGALHRVALLVQDLRDAAHADAADADEVDRADGEWHQSHRATSRGVSEKATLGTNDSTASAMRSAASGRASRRAASRIAASRSGFARRASSVAARRSADASVCGSRSAASDWASAVALAVW